MKRDYKLPANLLFNKYQMPKAKKPPAHRPLTVVPHQKIEVPKFTDSDNEIEPKMKQIEQLLEQEKEKNQQLVQKIEEFEHKVKILTVEKEEDISCLGLKLQNSEKTK